MLSFVSLVPAVDFKKKIDLYLMSCGGIRDAMSCRGGLTNTNSLLTSSLLMNS